MPNIEIYGIECLSNETLKLKMTIDLVMRLLGLENDAITTVISSDTCSCNRKPKALPFIRICSTNPEEIRKIVEGLKKQKVGQHGVDIETLVLSGFFLAKDLK